MKIFAYLKMRWRYVLMAGLLLPAAIHSQETRQYKVEAAYLYNFFNYIAWPGYNSPEALVRPTICVEQTDPVLPYLYYTQQHIRSERSMMVRKLAEKDGAAGCHILFLRRSPSSKQNIPAGTLLIIESDDDLERDGMIELVPQEEHLAIVIHNSILSQMGFKVSSRLLDLAEVR